MDTLKQQIRRAQTRLILQQFASRLAWCWFATLLVAAVAIAAGKYWPLDQQAWAYGWLGGALAAGLLAAAAWTWNKRHSPLTAAVEIDRRFGLKERVASTLALDSAQLNSDIGQALVRDTQQRVERIEVAEQFKMRPNRSALLPLASGALALVLALFVNGPELQQPAAATPGETVAVKKSTQALVKKLDERRKEAEEKGLTEADALLKQLEQATQKMADKSQPDKKQTLVALNELVKQAEQRRSQLAGGEEIKQQLKGLKNLQQGPAEKLGQALKTGDLAKAVKELDKLKEQLTGDKLDAKAKEQLAKQLEQLEQALEKKVQAQQQAQKDLEKQIEEQRRAGNTAEADKLQQQLDKLAAKSPQMEKLNEMAQQLKQAAENMKKGNSDQAAESLSKLGEQLAGMQQEMSEMEMLEGTLDEIANAKNSMGCKECEGEGCEACQGQGNRFSDKWSRRDFAKGGGIGAGKRDETKNDTDHYDSRVKQNVGKGASVVTGTADGPNRKGQVQEEIKSEYSQADQQTAEALSGQRLPHGYRDHAKKYFDSLREGRQQ